MTKICAGLAISKTAIEQLDAAPGGGANSSTEWH